MPAVLKPEAYATWLDPRMADAQKLSVLLSDKIQTAFNCRQVSTAVNATRHNSPANIDPLFDQAGSEK